MPVNKSKKNEKKLSGIFFLISAKVDTSAAAAAAAAAAEQQAEQQAEASRQSSIHNLVTKVMGEQSIHNIEVSKQGPATLTITPVRTGNNQNPTGNGVNTGNGSGQGRIIQMIDHGRTSAAVAAATSNVTRLRSRDLGSRDQQIRDQQPDTTESLD